MKKQKDNLATARNVGSVSLAFMLAVPLAYEMKGHTLHYSSCGFQQVLEVCPEFPPQDQLNDTASKNSENVLIATPTLAQVNPIYKMVIIKHLAPVL